MATSGHHQAAEEYYKGITSHTLLLNISSSYKIIEGTCESSEY
jgi:hypothetical protein